MAQFTVPEFADQLSGIMPIIMKEFSRRLSCDFKGVVTLPQILILEFLERQQEAKMKDFASFLGVSTAAVTGIIDRLVKYGYVVRIFEPADRRIIRIKLTPKGAALIRRFNLQRRQMIMRVFGRISEVDRGDYLRILGQIKDILLNDEIKQ